MRYDINPIARLSAYPVRSTYRTQSRISQIPQGIYIANKEIPANGKLAVSRYFFIRDINPLRDLRYTALRTVCASHRICAEARDGIDIISHLQCKYIVFIYRVCAADISPNSDLSHERLLLEEKLSPQVTDVV